MSLVYFALWVVFNGRVTLEIIIAGALISIMLDIFMRRILHLNLTLYTLMNFLKIFPDAVFYIAVLLAEIIRANFSIIKLVLAPELEVEPCLVKFNTPLKTETARAALANSITLTPGTITVSLEGNELVVHALNREIADGLQGSIFERLLARMESRVNA